MALQRDNRIAQLAVSQHGVVTRAQLIAAGISSSAITRRVSSGALKRLYPCVYRAGPVETPHCRAIAAVLACGTGAVLSHQSAGAAWELLAPLPADAPIDVTVRVRLRACLPGVTMHRALDLNTGDTTSLFGIPTTTPARTLLDLSVMLDRHTLERAVALAERRGLCDAKTLIAAAETHPLHRGVHTLRRLINQTDPPAFTRSEAEALLLDIVRKARLPAPRTNATVLGLEVDFLWGAAKLIVEVDGFAFHGSASAFTRDRRRDAALIAGGYRVMRFTWADLQERREVTLVMLAQALVR